MATVVTSLDGHFVAGTQSFPLRVANEVVLTLPQANTYTLPTNTGVGAQGPIPVGSSFTVVVTNGATFTATFAAASGETLVGTATATASPTRKSFVRTGATEWSVF